MSFYNKKIADLKDKIDKLDMASENSENSLILKNK
jgi:hypothetical protein